MQLLRKIKNLQILTCGVGHNTEPHHNLVSAESALAPTDGSVSPLPLNWAPPSWSLPSHQKQVIWAVGGRRGCGTDEVERDDSRWRRGSSLLDNRREAPLHRRWASSIRSGWETARDWPGALICSVSLDCLPGRMKKITVAFSSSVKVSKKYF